MATPEITKQILFVKEVLARLTGDNNEAVAAKIARKSISALQGQVSALTSKQVDDENALEDAQETLNNTIFPIALFTDNKAYAQSILNAQARVDAAQDNLDATNASLKYFNVLLKKVA
jgi:hypothetical protein